VTDAVPDIRSRIFRCVVDFDRTLVPLGHRELAPAWRELLERWLIGSQTRTLVVRKGRRIGASTVIAPRLAVAWVICAAQSLRLPPGESVIVGFVSVGRNEASDRLEQVAVVLDALQIAYESRPSAGEIALLDIPVRFRILTRNWRTAVGRTIGFLWCDEVSRWEDADTSANPAREVIASLMPSTATIPTSLVALVSSPWSIDDFHAERYELGDTKDQTTAFLPTWVGNPTLSEEDTHSLEPDLRIWSREYAAIPGATISQALDPSDVAAAFDVTPGTNQNQGFLSIDASSLRGDAFAWIAGHESRTGIVVAEVGSFEDDSLRTHTMADVVERIAVRAKAWRTSTVFGDQREEAGLRSLFAQRGIGLQTFAWSDVSKASAFTLLRRLLRDRMISLCHHEKLRKQMIGCKAHLMPSGRTRYATNGLDYLSALITLMHAVNDNLISAAPVAPVLGTSQFSYQEEFDEDNYDNFRDSAMWVCGPSSGDRPVEPAQHATLRYIGGGARDCRAPQRVRRAFTVP